MAVSLESDVRVNATRPVAIGTKMLREGFAGRERAVGELQRMHPTGTIGSPEDVAAAALLLSLANAAFLTACSLGLDGDIASRLHDPVYRFNQ